MNKEYGFKINKLIMIGKSKKDASLEFGRGLNVISGASDTGKTFIFQSLDYVFGGKNKPKEIEEAKGYDEVYVEIKNLKGETYTIRRNLTDGKMDLYECEYKNKDTILPISIKAKHDKLDKNNISTFLLNLCNCNYKNIIKNKNGETQSFSFRDFLRVSMLGEEKIIAEKSIVLGSAGLVKQTSNKNAFKTIITSLEDKGVQTKDEKKLTNLKIDAQIEMLDKFITNYNEELKKILVSEVTVDEINNLIKNIEKILKSKKEKFKKADEKKQSLIKENSVKENEINYNNELIKKFTLLKENYLSDLKRIEFIDDANYYINQLENVKCPICYSDMEDIKIDINKVNECLHAEKYKLKKKINDIDETIIIIRSKNTKLNKDKKDITKEIDILNNEMNLELKPLMDLKVSELEELLNKRDRINKKEFIEGNLEEAKKLRESLNKDRESDNNVDIKINNISDTNMEDLSSEVSTLLDKWKLFDNPNVKFDLQTYDLIINEKKKSSFGKGYRAIINSAFAIAIMKYSVARELPHPKVIILDSPLITFKEKDNEEEKISDIVKTSFYKYLSENFNQEQIIVLENADPNKDICKNITYHHFTKNNSYGRYGFFPI